MRRDDYERSLAFFRGLPKDDRVFLRRGVTEPDVIKNRMGEIRTGRIRRLVALAGDEIVADGTLELSGHGWQEHIAELRLIVARPFRGKGLGLLLAKELYRLAAKEEVEEIVVRMMRPQKGAHSVFRKLGFHEEVVLPDFVKDQQGKKQDLILMRCKLVDLWRPLEDSMAEMDWHGFRT
jgi:GNAT superfamily N-acetyltransferase